MRRSCRALPRRRYDGCLPEAGPALFEAAQAAHVSVEHRVRVRGATLCHRSEFPQPGRDHGRNGRSHAEQLCAPGFPGLCQGPFAKPQAGGTDHGHLHRGGVSLRLPDGAAVAGGAVGGDAVDHRAVLDQRAHSHLRLAHIAHGQRSYQYLADESGADPGAAQTALYGWRGAVGDGLCADSLHDPAHLHHGG